MSKKPIGAVSNIDSSGSVTIILNNGDAVQVDDISVSNNLRVGDTVYGTSRFSISGTASSDATSTILDEVTYDE